MINKTYEDKIYILDRKYINGITDYEFYESIKKIIEKENGIILEVDFNTSKDKVEVKWRKYKRKEEVSTRYSIPAYIPFDPNANMPDSKFDLVDAKLDAIELVTKYIDERLNKPLKVGEFEWGIDNETISKFKIRLNLARGKDVYPYGVFDFNKKVFHFTIQRMKNLVDRLEFEYTKLNDLKDETIKKINKCDRINHINKIIDDLDVY